MMKESRVLKVQLQPKGKEIKETLQRGTRTSLISNVKTEIVGEMVILLKSVGQRAEARKVKSQNRIKGRKRIKMMNQLLLWKARIVCIYLHF